MITSFRAPTVLHPAMTPWWKVAKHDIVTYAVSERNRRSMRTIIPFPKTILLTTYRTMKYPPPLSIWMVLGMKLESGVHVPSPMLWSWKCGAEEVRHPGSEQDTSFRRALKQPAIGATRGYYDEYRSCRRVSRAITHCGAEHRAKFCNGVRLYDLGSGT